MALGARGAPTLCDRLGCPFDCMRGREREMRCQRTDDREALDRDPSQQLGRLIRRGCCASGRAPVQRIAEETERERREQRHRSGTAAKAERHGEAADDGEQQEVEPSALPRLGARSKVRERGNCVRECEERRDRVIAPVGNVRVEQRLRLREPLEPDFAELRIHGPRRTEVEARIEVVEGQPRERADRGREQDPRRARGDAPTHQLHRHADAGGRRQQGEMDRRSPIVFDGPYSGQARLADGRDRDQGECTHRERRDAQRGPSIAETPGEREECDRQRGKERELGIDPDPEAAHGPGPHQVPTPCRIERA